MRRGGVRRALGFAGLVVAAAAGFPRPGAADEPRKYLGPYSLEGAISAGYRFLDRSGSKEKYREDYNLRSGGRLFNFAVNGTSSAPESTPVDRFGIEIDTPGNEPVSHFRLRASDLARFDFRAAFTRSKWEYAVPELFEAPVPENTRLDDLHDFDIIRTNGTVDLTIKAKNMTRVHVGYRFYDRDAGDDTLSTVRIQGGDSFLVRGPGHTTTHVGALGTTFRVLDSDVFLQQEYRRVNRGRTLKDPLDSRGLDPTDTSTLSSYHSEEDDHIDIPATTLRLRRSIGKADVTAAYFFSRAYLDFNYDRTRRGTDNVGGFGGTATATGDGTADLTTHVADLETVLHLSDRVRLYGSYRFNDRRQHGDFDERSEFGLLAARADNDVTVHSVRGEIEYELLANLLLRAGAHYSYRDADFEQISGDQTTHTVGAIGSIRYQPWSCVDLFARYENVQIEDPLETPGDSFSIPSIPAREIVLTDTNRGSAGVRLRPWAWAELRYQLTADHRDNDTFDGTLWALGNSIAVTLTPLSGLTVLTSYTRRDLDNRADILTAPLYEPTSAVQTGTENVIVSVLQYDFQLFGQQWSGGGNVSYVDSDSSYRPRLETDGGTRTDFDLDRVDGAAFLTLRHRLLEPTVEVRRIDYDQNPLTKNDYAATVVTLKLTKRFDF